MLAGVLAPWVGNAIYLAGWGPVSHMDLTPFAAINPCGYAGLRVTQCRDIGVAIPLPEAERALAKRLLDTIYS